MTRGWICLLLALLASCGSNDAAPLNTTPPKSEHALAVVVPESTPVSKPVTTNAVPSTTTIPPRPAWPSAGLEPGSEGTLVELLQADLEALGFRTGDSIDGVYGAGTTSAVMAFEKFEGLDRDGVADAEMLAALAEPTGIVPLGAMAGAPRIEIDLERQLLFARADNGQIKILNTSTGSGETYQSSSGSYVRATTPTGDYRIERRIDGVRNAFLGSLYRPLYFKRGWAIHGSSSVPAYPASHGCARLRNDDQDWMFDTFRDGTEVTVYEFNPVLAPVAVQQS